jgi:hypothetical protein
LEEIFFPALKLAARIFKSFPLVAEGNLPEPDDLVNELIVRYGEGKRLYQWPHWLVDKDHVNWTKFVFFRMVGRERLGVMASIAVVRNDPTRRPPPIDPIGNSDDDVGVDSAYVDLEETDLTDANDLLDSATADALVASPDLLHNVIIECAINGGFEPHSSKALDVYKDIYERTPEDTDQSIAGRWSVPVEFVQLCRDQEQLITIVRKHCAEETLDRICDIVSKHLTARALGSTDPLLHDAGARAQQYRHQAPPPAPPEKLI